MSITFTINNMQLQNNAFISTYSHAIHFTHHLSYHNMHLQCNNSIHNQFMRFKHIHKNPIYTRQCWLFLFDYSIHIYDGFRLMNPAPFFSFGNMSTHFTIRSPIMTDAVWCIPTRGITYSVSHHDGCRLVHPDTWYHLFGSPIMTDAVWCIPTRGITYSVLPS